MRREDWLLGIKFLLSVIFIQRDELRVCQRKKSLMVVEWLLFSEKYKQLSGDLRALVPAIVMPVFYCPITISPRILSLRTKTNICNLSRAWWGSSTWGLCSTHCQLGGWTEGSGMAHSRGAGGGGHIGTGHSARAVGSERPFPSTRAAPPHGLPWSFGWVLAARILGDRKWKCPTTGVQPLRLRDPGAQSRKRLA